MLSLRKHLASNPLPSPGRSPLAWHRLNLQLLLVPGALAVLVLPYVLDRYMMDIAVIIAIYIVLAMGLNVVVGLAGLLDLGYVAFYAVGAYSMGILGTALGFSFWAVLPIALVLGAAAGVLIGGPTLRLRSDYLALVTLGFGEIVRISINNLGDITGGPNGLINIPHPVLFGYDFGLSPQPYFYFISFLALVAVVIVGRLQDSHIGRGWIAIREDEGAAEAMGINTTRMKLLAFATGATFAAGAGVFFASRMGFTAPESFSFWESTIILCMVVLGGMGSTPGVLLGVLVLIVLPEALREFSQFRMVLFGAALVAMMLFRPEGFLPSTRTRREFRSQDGDPESAEAHLQSKAGAVDSRGLDHVRVKQATTNDGPLLECRGVSKHYGGVVALNSVGFELRQGEILGLIGPNGAGKTSMFNLITGSFAPTAGSILFDGRNLAGLKPHRITRAGIGRTFQNIRLFGGMTALENVMAAEQGHMRSTLPMVLLRTRSQRQEEGESRARAEALLRFVGLADTRDTLARNLPYGDQRRLEIARALAVQPRLLLLDEPAAGMNATETHALIGLIKATRDLGVTILLIEHDMQLVMGISDRVIVLNFGCKIAEGPPEKVQNDPQVIEAYLGQGVAWAS